MSGQVKSHLVRNLAIVSCAVIILAGAAILIPNLMQDSWELYNGERITSKLNEAERLQQSDPLAAYKIFDEAINESRLHKITDEDLEKKLSNAEAARTVLYAKVQAKIAAEAAEKQRKADEETRRAAAEKKRIADEQERARIADERRREEEKERKEAVQAYRSVPQSARDTLNAIKKLQARTEVGVNYADYTRAVGETWGDVKVYVESPDGKLLPQFSNLLTKAIADYKSARNVWNDKIQFPSLAQSHERELEDLQQRCWLRADKRIAMAEALLDPNTTESTLANLSDNQIREEDFDKELNDLILK